MPTEVPNLKSRTRIIVFNRTVTSRVKIRLKLRQLSWGLIAFGLIEGLGSARPTLIAYLYSTVHYRT